ncbi:chloride channel protein [Paraoerskovia sediminicola]|uniref:chloride channel protein n=1 Tax=Paraoerskovia sediminicola TaxID=1138587 RepID=UPI0025736FC3|nr:chloride channel protein [Paraoerskovia sediminicola]
MVGGLIYGPLVYFGAREARGHGVPEVMVAVARHGGRIRARVAAVKALASAVTIGSGGSVGREGPIVQIGAALGSTFGQWTRMPLSRMRTLVAAGSAAGIAATFNAPIAGVIFALELILRDFTARSFGLVVLSSVTASVVGRSMLGNDPFLILPAFTVDHAWAYLLFALLGIIAGAVGIGFARILYVIEDLCDKIWRGPEWLRPAVGGVFLGLILLVLPQMYGVGYPVLEAGVNGRYAIGVLILLLVGKIIATSLTLGIGGSGGVFAPSLFVGGMLGAAFGEIVNLIAPELTPSAGAFAIVGMGAVFAGSARAPLTAVIMLFELTGEYSIILPLMLAIVLATGISRMLSKETVYSLKLARRGIDLDEHPADRVLGDLLIADVMDPSPPSVESSTRLDAASRLLLASGRTSIPVVDDGRLRGHLRADMAAESLHSDDEVADQTVGHVIDEVGRVDVGLTLRDALAVLHKHPEDEGIAVVDADGAMVGWLTHRQVLGALSAATATPDSPHGPA